LDLPFPIHCVLRVARIMPSCDTRRSSLSTAQNGAIGKGWIFSSAKAS
jgi:hypothetical protein